MLGGAGVSGTFSALAFGGFHTSKAKTEVWNGSSWTEVNDLSTATRRFLITGSAVSASITCCWGMLQQMSCKVLQQKNLQQIIRYLQ